MWERRIALCMSLALFVPLLAGAAIVACSAPGGGGEGEGGNVDAGAPSGYLVLGAFRVRDDTNDPNPADAIVDATLAVTRGGAPVDGLQVLMNPPPPSFQTVLVEQTAGSGVYAGNWIGYGGSVQVTVNAGRATLLSSAVAGGPSLHRVDMPAPGALVDPRAPLSVVWSPSGMTAGCALSTPSNSYQVPDTGSYVLPAGAFGAVASDGGAAASWVEVDRSVTTSLSALAPGSQVVFTVAVKSPVQVETVPGADGGTAG